MTEHYDLIVVGTGFASSMFLHRFLQKRKNARILVLEKGAKHAHAWQTENPKKLGKLARASFDNSESPKPWVFTLAFGGGSNCWWACAPRMFPDDFELNSRYGVGVDWPITYAELETYYVEAERLMNVAGPADSPFPRSAPYPQKAHRFSTPDRALKKAYPNHFFNQPSARPTQAVGQQPACCNNGVCGLCPINSKFTIMNGMPELYASEGVLLKLEAAVQRVELKGNVATGVHYEQGGKELFAASDLVVLGANGIFNPHILLKSGLSHAEIGSGLVEQVSVNARVYLHGMDNFDGSTAMTGHGYNFYSGEHRKQRAAAMIETWNMPDLRLQRGKWRQVLELKFIIEDLRQPENRVLFDASDASRPKVVYRGFSAYARQALAHLESDVAKFVAVLPVEHIEMKQLNATESHVLGTTVMGNDPESSVVDRNSVQHQVRNLLVLGSGTFPTAAPANPTLTLSALSLRAADQLLASQAYTP